MGLMRFLVDPCDPSAGAGRERSTPPHQGWLTERRVARAYMTGIDRVPWRTQCRVEIDSGDRSRPATAAPIHPAVDDTAPQPGPAERIVLVVERSVSDSGCLNILWPDAEFGEVLLSTGSLRERPEPYDLVLELARGTLNRVRSQLAEWQTLRLAVPPVVPEKLLEATRLFARAAVGVHASANGPTDASAATRSIALTLAAGQALAAAYVEQSIGVRRRGGGRLRSMLGVNLGDGLLDEATGTHVLRSFNAAQVPLRWRCIETSESERTFAVADRQAQWCKVHRLGCVGGPLLDFDPRSLPDWLALFEGDFENVLSCVTDFVRTVVERYRGKVDMWYCAARMNTGEVLDLSEREMLELTARVVEIVAELDPDRPRLVGIDQPWAESMARRETAFPPLHLADAMRRARLDISGFGLEIEVDAAGGKSLPRTPLEMSRQLDLWAGLGVPIHLFVAVPSGEAVRGDDPAWTARQQQAWVARQVPMMLAKPFVQGVFWNQLLDADADGHGVACGGLFDSRRRMKPALRTLAAIRRTHLK